MVSHDLTADLARRLQRAAREEKERATAQAARRGAEEAECHLPSVLRAIEKIARGGGGSIDLSTWAPAEQPSAFYNAYHKRLAQLLEARGFRRRRDGTFTWLRNK